LCVAQLVHQMQILATGRIVWTNMVVGKLPRPSTAAEHMFLTNKAIQNIPEAGTLCVAQLVHKMQVLVTGRIVWTNMDTGKLPRPSTAAEHMSLTNKAIQNISWACTTV